ncbi:MAG: Fic/DOC family [Candidatus Parcubacteria bacterium]|jgi:hypothetical protein
MTQEQFPQQPAQSKRESDFEKMETGKKVFDFLERIKFLEFRKSDEDFEKWIKQLSFEEFEQYLNRLNGMMRSLPKDERGRDGDDVKIETSNPFISYTEYLPPDSSQKDSLMKEAFVAFKQISNNEDRALLLYYIIQAVHPYSDGNGRLGRLLYELVSSSGKDLKEEDLSKYLDHNKKGHNGNGEGREFFAKKILEPKHAYYYINREVAREVLGKGFTQEYGKLYLYSPLDSAPTFNHLKEGDDGLSVRELSLAQTALQQTGVDHFSFSGLILSKLMQEKSSLQKYQKQGMILGDNFGVAQEDVNKHIFSIDDEEMVKEFTAGDVRRIIEINSDLKIKFVRTIIDIFVHPESHQVKVSEDEESLPIKQLFS